MNGSAHASSHLCQEWPWVFASVIFNAGRVGIIYPGIAGAKKHNLRFTE